MYHYVNIKNIKVNILIETKYMIYADVYYIEEALKIKDFIERNIHLINKNRFT
jgi:hypothetical protein